MKRAFSCCLSVVFASTAVFSQVADREKAAPLVLTARILMPGVAGRLDHMALDPKGTLFVSALGNDSEELIDLSAAVRSNSLHDVPRPQGVAFAPEFNKLFVASDEGKLFIFDAQTRARITTIDFGDDVDNLRYDAAHRLLYVGYGDGEEGAIAAVDAATNHRLPKEFKLGAHPESFQLEATGSKIYVNVPDLHQIAAIDRNTGAIERWPVPFQGNFPMALDEPEHRLFIATAAPSRMAAFDTSSGKMVAALPAAVAADDLYYDAARKRIYVPGGDGTISVFQENDRDHYSLLATVASEIGAHTAGYFGKGSKGFDRFYVAVPASPSAEAHILVYTLQD